LQGSVRIAPSSVGVGVEVRGGWERRRRDSTKQIKKTCRSPSLFVRSLYTMLAESEAPGYPADVLAFTSPL
jgi:hypothetical protein